MLAGLTTISQVISVLGEPTERIPRSIEDAKIESIYNIEPIKETLVYKKFRTIYVCIQETAEGNIVIRLIRAPRKLG